jgi:hypothetical protein
MKLTVSVEQSHIDRGERNSCCACPIALAMNEQHPRDSSWRIGLATACIGWTGRASYLPPRAIKFVRSFDDKKEVKPFTFRLETRD